MQRYTTAPCKYCGSRTLGCHGKCKKYMEFHEFRKFVSEERHKEQERAGLTASYKKRQNGAIRRGEKG